MSTNTVRETRTELFRTAASIDSLANFFPNSQTADANEMMSEAARIHCIDNLKQAEKLLDEVRAILFQVQK